jgi:two-component system response regulator HydG
MKPEVLAVDDDQNMRQLLEAGLRSSFSVSTAASAENALELIRDREFDVVVADVNLHGASGLELCARVSELRPDLPVLVITAYGTMETAIAAIRAGAHDFVNKPVDIEQLSHTIGRAAEHKQLRDEVKRLRQRPFGAEVPSSFVGDSRAMRKVYELIERVGPTDVAVLITGESGTGKELAARAIHNRSARSGGQFVAINCAAVPANLLESELFGHVKGAFTDAKSDKKGLFVEADGGTLFLDEIAEMPPEMQVKLLRVLQESKVRPVGGTSELAFDTRIIAATNRDLDEEVESGHFREDLYYRLHVVGLRMPPLRSRGHDVLALAQHFIDEAADTMHKPVRGLAPEAARKLLDYDWPGNVRELENTIERAVALTRRNEITVEDLPDKVRSFESGKLVITGDDPDEMPTLNEVERRYINRVLKATDGNKTHAAKVLGLDRRTLYRKLDRYQRDSH